MAAVRDAAAALATGAERQPSAGASMKLSIAIVGLEVVGAEEGDHLAPGDVLDAGGELVAHGGLVGTARLEDEVAAAVADQAALALGHEVLDDDRDQVVVEVRAGLGRAAAGVLAEQTHDEIADGEAMGPLVAGSNWRWAKPAPFSPPSGGRIAREKEGDG
jgi:hypothetical protein